jgi:hypothetical protein
MSPLPYIAQHYQQSSDQAMKRCSLIYLVSFLLIACDGNGGTAVQIGNNASKFPATGILQNTDD